MGCCLSHSEGPNAPYPDGAASASERAIAAPSVGGRSSFVSGPVAAPPAPAAAYTSDADGGNGNSDDSDATIASASSIAAAVRSQPRAAQLPAVPFAAASAPGGGSGGGGGGGGSRPASHPSSSSAAVHPLAQHINKPLGRPRRWSARNHLWSRQSIDRERVDFFDTRVTGRIEIWQTLRVVLELQWEAERAAAAAAPVVALVTGATDDHAKDEARATAQTILDAAAITLPTGDLAQGVYDVFGNFYALPAWIVSDPTNLLEREPGEDDDDDDEDEDDSHNDSDESEDADADADADRDGDDEGEDSDPRMALKKRQRRRRSGHVDVAADVDGSDTLSSNSSDDDHDDDDDGADADADHQGLAHHRRREEKGKAVLSAADAADTADNDDDASSHRHHHHHRRRRPVTVALRARLSLTGRDVVLRVGRDASIRSVAHQIVERAKLSPTSRVRIAYMGRILKEGHSLSAQGWKEGHVVNALVFEAPSDD